MPKLCANNPWLEVPLAEYEGHMTSAAVQQLDALSGLFAEALVRCEPASVAIPGIAGGNGLQHIDGKVTRRVLGIDIHPAYLAAVRARYPQIAGLELVCLDLADRVVESNPVQLVHVALVFEHAGVGLCLDNALRLVEPGGRLSVVLQLPSELAPGVGSGTYESIQNLSAGFAMIDPDWFVEAVGARGFRLTFQTRRALESGKGFWMGIFARDC